MRALGVLLLALSACGGAPFTLGDDPFGGSPTGPTAASGSPTATSSRTTSSSDAGDPPDGNASPPSTADDGGKTGSVHADAGIAPVEAGGVSPEGGIISREAGSVSPEAAPDAPAPPSCPSGCLDANGACQSGASTHACGTSGVSCRDCASTGDSCVAGACVAGWVWCSTSSGLYGCNGSVCNKGSVSISYEFAMSGASMSYGACDTSCMVNGHVSCGANGCMCDSAGNTLCPHGPAVAGSTCYVTIMGSAGLDGTAVVGP